MRVRKSVEEGRTIVDPLKESGMFPNMVTQMIGVGEATGAMDAMLQKIADFYEDEVDAAAKNLLTMLEPVMIGILGVCAAVLVVVRLLSRWRVSSRACVPVSPRSISILQWILAVRPHQRRPN